MNVFCCFPLIFDTEAQIYEIISMFNIRKRYYKAKKAYDNIVTMFLLDSIEQENAVLM